MSLERGLGQRPILNPSETLLTAERYRYHALNAKRMKLYISGVTVLLS